MGKKAFLVVLAPIPTLFVGAIVMHRFGISAAIYGQNIICYLVLGLLLLFACHKTAATPISKPAGIALTVLAGLLLVLTFLDRGLNGVHRWVAVGGFRLYIASMVLPAVVLLISKLWQENNEVVSAIIILIFAAILSLQPDASQLSAFAVAMGFVTFRQAKNKTIKYAIPLVLIGCIAYAWMRIDGLEAVPHVEGILQLSRGMGVVMYALGICSLVILLLPFLNFSNVSILAKAVGLYYLAVIASTFFGNFPVPFMGYGVSPIVGYMLVIFVLMRENEFALQQKHQAHLRDKGCRMDV